MSEIATMGIAAALGLAGAGSALGIGAAGAAAIGAWKKLLAAGKPAPFILLSFVGAPLTQTFYGLILMNRIVAYAAGNTVDLGIVLGAGIFGGIAMGFSAWLQGVAGAGACDAFSETGKGFGNFMIVLGVVETVALLVMVFLFGVLPT